MPTYSPSKLSCYEKCPLQYQYHYIDKIKVERVEGVEAFMGSMIHFALEELYSNVKLQKILTVEEVIDFYNNEWNKEWHDEIYIAKKNLTKDNYFNKGKQAIEDYYKSYFPFNQSAIVCTEMQMNFCLDKDENYKMTGIIDRLDKRSDEVFEIHDYKSGSSLPTQRIQDNDQQLALYQIGIQSMWSDVKEVELVWHFVVHNVEIRSKRTKEQLYFLANETIELIDEIEENVKNGNMPPKKTGLCGWCDFQKICPKKKHNYI